MRYVRFLLVLPLWALLFAGCSSVKPSPTFTPPPPTATLEPTATPSPRPTFTPTIPPTLTPTPGPYEELDASRAFALTYKRADWERIEDTTADAELRHRHMDCTLRFSDMAGDAPMARQTSILGYSFLTFSGPGVETWVGPRIFGASISLPPIYMDIVSKTSLAQCKRAARQLLATLHLTQWAQGQCRPTFRLEPGDRIHTVDYVYLRSEPRWAEETRLKQVKPNLEMEVVGGPVCAPYKKGIYVYWQVRLPNDATAWVAEGDPQGPYIEPER